MRIHCLKKALPINFSEIRLILVTLVLLFKKLSYFVRHGFVSISLHLCINSLELSHLGTSIRIIVWCFYSFHRKSIWSMIIIWSKLLLLLLSRTVIQWCTKDLSQNFGFAIRFWIFVLKFDFLVISSHLWKFRIPYSLLWIESVWTGYHVLVLPLLFYVICSVCIYLKWAR